MTAWDARQRERHCSRWADGVGVVVTCCHHNSFGCPHVLLMRLVDDHLGRQAEREALLKVGPQGRVWV
jgi:hypothetical protein